MKVTIKSAAGDFPANPAGIQATFTIVCEIEYPFGPSRPEDHCSNIPQEFHSESEYVMWKGTVHKRTVPFLCVGDN